VGFFSSQTRLLDVLLIGVRLDTGGPESEEPGRAMVRRCLEEDFPLCLGVWWSVAGPVLNTSFVISLCNHLRKPSLS
jgi:hypothetical protein